MTTNASIIPEKTVTIPCANKIIVTVEDESMIEKVRNAILMLRGVSEASVPNDDDDDEEEQSFEDAIKEALEDVKAGRVHRWNSVDEMFNTLMND